MLVETFYGCHQCGCNSYYRRLCPDCKQRYDQERYRKNKTRLLEQAKNYRKNNKDKVNTYYRNRRQKDKTYQLKANLRTRLWNFLHDNNHRKRLSTEQMLGCSWEEYKSYIEDKFLDGMSWDNRDEWHIDHIVPLASAESEDELITLFHYTNTQPLWAAENLAKGHQTPSIPSHGSSVK